MRAPLPISLVASLGALACVGPPSELAAVQRSLAPTQHVKALERLSDTPTHETDPAVSKDGALVAFTVFDDESGDHSHLEVMSPSDRSRHRVTPVGSDAAMASWASKNELLFSFRAVATSDSYMRAAVLDLRNEGDAPRILPPPYNNVHVQWPSAFRTKDGFRVVEEISQDVFGRYFAMRYEWRQLVVSDPDTLAMVKIGNGKWPSFSPDGRRIAFTGAGGRVLVADASNGEVLYYLMPGEMPAWSPDGAQLVFCAPSDQGGKDLFVVPATGGAVKQLTAGEADSCRPAWASDGWIYFHSNAAKSFDLWRVRMSTPQTI
jgi:Tol biopolymer transport system component